MFELFNHFNKIAAQLEKDENCEIKTHRSLKKDQISNEKTVLVIFR
jgi:hypothetical protein